MAWWIRSFFTSIVFAKIGHVQSAKCSLQISITRRVAQNVYLAQIHRIAPPTSCVVDEISYDDPNLEWTYVMVVSWLRIRTQLHLLQQCEFYYNYSDGLHLGSFVALTHNYTRPVRVHQ